MKVDCQSHVFSKAYAEVLLESSGFVRTTKENGSYIVRYGDIQQFNLDPAIYNPEYTIRDMDDAGIDVSVLSINIPGPELLEPESGVKGARICNDYLAEVCAAYPGRFVGLAALPMQDTDEALNEFRRALDTLDLRGMVLYSHINGTPVDAAVFEPVYRMAEERQVPVVLHPTVPTWGETIKDYSMIPMIGLMVDTSIAVLRLILSGILERYPNLKVLHPHCGGVLPYLMPRVVEQTEVKGRGREHIKKSPEAYYKNVYQDLVSPSEQAMRFSYESAGPDRLVFGSDRPWVSIQTFLEIFNRLDIPEIEKEKILGKNACRLFRIK